MKLINRGVILRTATLSYLLIAQGVHAELSPLESAAVASRRDSDPALNGAIGEARQAPVKATVEATAVAARRDSDPALNGSPLPVAHDVARAR